jgi:4'-phosphopantetheinyl transferase
MSAPALDLRPGQAHLWRLSMAVGAERRGALAATLDQSEQARLAAFRVDAPRERFIASRGLLRATLARYVGAPPASLRFCAGAHGKPALDGEPDDGLRFNLSHSDDLLLIAIARGAEVGVDLEHVRPILGMRQIAAALLTPAEQAELDQAPAAQRDALFTHHWARHEAIAKGEGYGMARAGAPLRAWSVFDLSPWVGHPSALALEGRGWHVGAFAPQHAAGPAGSGVAHPLLSFAHPPTAAPPT